MCVGINIVPCKSQASDANIAMYISEPPSLFVREIRTRAVSCS